jgi:hypothetical protein
MARSELVCATVSIEFSILYVIIIDGRWQRLMDEDTDYDKQESTRSHLAKRTSPLLSMYPAIWLTPFLA